MRLLRERLALMHQVARHLTGKKVEILFEEPPTSRPSNGSHIVHLDGTSVVHLRPGLEYGDDDELLRVLTHELAHVVKHRPVMTRVDVLDQTKVFHQPSRHESPVVQAREDEAETLAESWRRHVFMNWFNYHRYQESVLDAKLKTLLTYGKD